MQNQMLPAAEKLYKAEKERLSSDYDGATRFPWIAIGLGVVALAALGWAQRRNYRRTNRMFNHGLLAATAASTVVLLWLAVGHTVARAELNGSYDNGAKSLSVLNDARIAALKARGSENLTLVARGAVTVTVDDKTLDAYDTQYKRQMAELAGGKGSGLLGEALAIADRDQGRSPVRKAKEEVKAWKNRHQEARRRDDAGDYDGALAKVIGDDRPTSDSFYAVEKALDRALDVEQGEFDRAAGDGRDAMRGLPVGAGVLAVLAAVGAVLGIGRRLSEYR
ncbi:hypothetical protein GBW32_11560 [Streptomyces tsukubensis]|nr:hypothetical protein GBW32_11560 [Streptomyces tsukubensis]